MVCIVEIVLDICNLIKLFSVNSIDVISTSSSDNELI